MKLNSLNLHAFFTAARLGHFTKASEELHISQSALSQRIGKLEEELETSLFVRDKKQVRLTDAGHELLRYCQMNSEIEEDLIKKLRTTENSFGGHLRIGCFSSVGRSLVIPSLKKLLQCNPQLTFSLVTKETSDLALCLEQSEVDYIVTTQKNNRNDFETHFLGYEENFMVEIKNNPLKKTYLDHDRRDETTHLFLKENKIKSGVVQQHFLDDVYGLIEGVKAGLGRAVLPAHLIKNEKNFITLHKPKSLKVPVYLQFYSQPYYRSLHKEVVEDLISYFSKSLCQK